ncbi:hypothetical protein KFE25_006027 [Diacronema lutheri]|uniref:Coatomer subunit gamma n=1 Tax=Diacronema lutheri TaxID=2081491 RepID=A0A8J5XVU4_DIALT|nr:hypothetical protein KFE25_006027 [Diacronema lutheri]
MQGGQALPPVEAQQSDWQTQGSQWLSGVKDAAMSTLATGGGGGKKDEDEVYSPFLGLEKSQVLQECRVFNDPQLNPRLCAQLITKILYMLGQGEQLSRSESTSIFFGVTKLFQAKDDHLRRMIYLVMKELNPSAEEVIIVTATLTKDMNSKQDLYRANAIRVLCKIISMTDPTMLGQIERHLKQALVDKNAFVAASALVSSIQLIRVNAEVVKRWVNEVQTALQSDNQTVQYHALALLHMIKKQDRLAVNKIVSSLTRTPIKSPLAQCLLIRFVKKVMDEEGGGGERDRTLLEFLEGTLRHKSDVVIYEGANALCGLPNVSQRELSPAITVLQLFLCSNKPTLRFAAARTLNRIAMLHPAAVTPCNMDLEGLINDANRSIATLAITTLLKTGSEAGVERLMKQITTFMSEIADEFKVIVVDAIRSMCIKFPQKHRLLMTFLSNMLREEGGFTYKKAIVDTILELIAQIPDAKEAGLMNLCEFIEDCEFTPLSTAILAVLGTEGPATAEPSSYIRFIYNRVVLENATVRASAVSALAKFGVQLPQLRSSIVTLLLRCLHDNDDEVRDRATLYCSMLQKMEVSPDDVFGIGPAQLCLQPLPVPLLALEHAVAQYLAQPSDEPFSVFNVTMSAEMLAAERKAAHEQSAARRKAENHDGGSRHQMMPGTPGKAAAKAVDASVDYLAKIPQFAHVGPRFSSSKPAALTDPETEYSCACIKHVYARHTILAFELRNTIDDQYLQDVRVALDLAGTAGLEVEVELPCPALPFGVAGQAFILLRRTEAAPTGSLGCTLRFRVREAHAETHEPLDSSAGYEDEYALEELELAAADYMKRLMVADFRAGWEGMGNGGEVIETFSLTYSGLPEAIRAIVDFLGMEVCEGTGTPQDGARTHTVLLSGAFLSGAQVLAIVNLRTESAKQVGMRLSVRSADKEISQFVASCVA